MLNKIKVLILFLLIFLFTFSFKGGLVYSETPTLTPTVSPTPGLSPDDQKRLQDLQNLINQYQQKITDLQGQQKTLNSQISIMDSQIKITELRMDETKQKIDNLQKDIEVTKDKISGLEKDISYSTKALIGRISAVYELGKIDAWQMFLTSNNISNFMTRLKYLKIVQMYDKKNIYASEQAKINYANQKTLLEDKQKEEEALKKKLEDYTKQINQEKKSKEDLVILTRNDESRYQKLLNEAQAQIKGFKSFSASQTGGQVSILPPQDSPDGWYYNQRDERWGRNRIGASSEQVWDVGCLLTSTAMVLKKHGDNVTPSDVASNSSYFFSDTAYMLIPWAGGRFSSVWGYNQSEVDNKLSIGEPVIIGVRAGAYGMHFIVLKSGSKGDYVMNDPWYGPNLKFSDHYSTSQIFQYGYYN